MACDKSSFSMSAIRTYLERHRKQEIEADSLAISKTIAVFTDEVKVSAD